MCSKMVKIESYGLSWATQCVKDIEQQKSSASDENSAWRGGGAH